MYKFNVETNLDEFDKFVLNNNGSVFQTSMGAKQKNDWQPLYIMAEDEDKKKVLSSLLLVRKVAKVFKMGYIPLGFVCNYDNSELVKEAIEYLKNFTKKENIGLCFIDPTVLLSKNKEIDERGTKVLTIFESALKKTKRFRPYIQPDTTYIINLADEKGETKALDQIVNTFEKGVKYSIRTSSDRGLKYESFCYHDIKDKPFMMDEFMAVMDDTMNRLEASTRSKKYFNNMLKNFDPYAHLNMVYYDVKEDQSRNEENLKRLASLDSNNKKQMKEINELNQKIESYNKRLEEIKSYNIDITNIDKLYLAGGITVIFGNKAICLYGGSKNVLRNSTRSSHFLNYKRIEDSINHKCVAHDLSRIQLQYWDARDRDYGLYLFKRSFNADEVKYIGEFSIINNHLMYLMFTKMLPLARKILKMVRGTN